MNRDEPPQLSTKFEISPKRNPESWNTLAMYDCTFDDETASQWINVIEATKVSVRDKDIYPKVQSWVDYAPLPSVLEIGSGQGICSEKIDLKGSHYTGLEPSPKMTARAKELYATKERNFVLGNA